jgi:hypothetical protein
MCEPGALRRKLTWASSPGVLVLAATLGLVGPAPGQQRSAGQAPGPKAGAKPEISDFPLPPWTVQM